MITKTIIYKNSKLKVIADNEYIIDTAYNEIITQRTIIENYADKNFLNSLVPVKIKKNSPKIIKEMTLGAGIANVGQMATVAGVLAEFAAKKAIEKHKPNTVVVENGGDVFAFTKDKINIGLFSGNNKLKNKLCFQLTKENTPLSICSSSSIMGHSLSFGKCDLAVVFSKKSGVADALCTAAANKVKKQEDIENTLNWLKQKKYFLGAIIILNDKIGLIGQIPKLMKNYDLCLEDKITKL